MIEFECVLDHLYTLTVRIRANRRGIRARLAQIRRIDIDNIITAHKRYEKATTSEKTTSATVQECHCVVRWRGKHGKLCDTALSHTRKLVTYDKCTNPHFPTTLSGNYGTVLLFLRFTLIHTLRERSAVSGLSLAS